MKDTDKKVLEYYQQNPKARQVDVEAALGIKVATIRNIRSRLERAGLAPWIAAPAKTVVEVRPTSAARLLPERITTRITLPTLSIQGEEPETKQLRLAPVSRVDPVDAIKARNLALIKKVHREGQRRGLFR